MNLLDAACREHDIKYSQSKAIDTKHQADKIERRLKGKMNKCN